MAFCHHSMYVRYVPISPIPLTEEQKIEVERNYGLVHHFAKRCSDLADSDDIKQEIAVSLMKAVQRHDPNRGTLSTTMTWGYRAAILRHQRKNRWFGGTSHRKEPPIMYTETPLHEEDLTLGDTLASDGASPEETAAYRELLEMAMPPTPREREIVRLRLEGFNLSEIGKRFGLSGERIRQVLGEIVGRMEMRTDMSTVPF